jgi:hypothetical protein
MLFVKCACELRSPAQFTDAGFVAFNRHYVERLAARGIFREEVNLALALKKRIDAIKDEAIRRHLKWDHEFESAFREPSVPLCGSGCDFVMCGLKKASAATLTRSPRGGAAGGTPRLKLAKAQCFVDSAFQDEGDLHGHPVFRDSAVLYTRLVLDHVEAGNAAQRFVGPCKTLSNGSIEALG